MGWRQGVILSAALLLDQIPDDLQVSGDDYLLAVSQSCDLVNHDLEKEPHVVFLLLKSREGLDAMLAHGRNPRVIHFPDSGGTCFEAIAWQQIVLPRARLLDVDLSEASKLSDWDLQIVTGWLAKRFTRTAFPDDFNEALRPKDSLIKKALKKRHHLFTEMLVGLHPFDDLGEGQNYELACYLLMSPEQYKTQKSVEEARMVAFKLEAAFEECGIEVVTCVPVSEGELTYAESKELVRWDYDHLTYRDSPQDTDS